MTESCRITALYAYPVKSCRGNTLSSIEISPQGVSGDRQLVILQNDRFINQARLPALAKLAATRIDLEEIELAHGADASLRHRIAAQGRELTIEYYGNQVPVIDQGDALAEFASTVVGTPIRLAALKSSFTRAIPLPEFSIVDGIEQNRFVDAAPILLTNVGSLDDLNTRLETPVPMGRFRPNIVVEGLDPYAEDTVSSFSGAGWSLQRATHCERCAVTCTDQETGERTREPLATLKSYRHREGGYAGGVMFGAYMGVEGRGTLRVGDVLHVERSL